MLRIRINQKLKENILELFGDYSVWSYLEIIRNKIHKKYEILYQKKSYELNHITTGTRHLWTKIKDLKVTLILLPTGYYNRKDSATWKIYNIWKPANCNQHTSNSFFFFREQRSLGMSFRGKNYSWIRNLRGAFMKWKHSILTLSKKLSKRDYFVFINHVLKFIQGANQKVKASCVWESLEHAKVSRWFYPWEKNTSSMQTEKSEQNYNVPWTSQQC